MAKAGAVAEFDAVAAEYAQQHAQSISFSGEEPAYFAEYKARKVAAAYRAEQAPAPRDVLDFGGGIGNSVGPLLGEFPKARMTCLDVSQASLDICSERFGGKVVAKLFDGRKIPLPEASFDMVFVACVFHHVDHAEHGAALRELHRVLRPGGRLFLFEHNPWNPATRIAVANCPFDENAVLIDPITMRRRIAAGGFKDCRTSFGPFFPAFLSFLRPAERLLGWLPMGAQYVVHGRKD
jgi:ubiquinone/menaquinone biosynthesis C-methylase UbiE